MGDITYIPTQEGWLYLAVLIDLYSRAVVGWALFEQKGTRPISIAKWKLARNQQLRPVIRLQYLRFQSLRNGRLSLLRWAYWAMRCGIDGGIHSC